VHRPAPESCADPPRARHHRCFAYCRPLSGPICRPAMRCPARRSPIHISHPGSVSLTFVPGLFRLPYCFYFRPARKLPDPTDVDPGTTEPHSDILPRPAPVILVWCLVGKTPAGPQRETARADRQATGIEDANCIAKHAYTCQLSRASSCPT